MRPPMQSTALQQNETIRQQHCNQQQQQQQQYNLSLDAIQVQQTGEKHQKHIKPIKLEQREILVENHLNFVCTAAAASAATVITAEPKTTTTPTYHLRQQQQQSYNVLQRKHSLKHDYNNIDGIVDTFQLVDLSTTTPSVVAPFTHHSELYHYKLVPTTTTATNNVSPTTEISVSTTRTTTNTNTNSNSNSNSNTNSNTNTKLIRNNKSTSLYGNDFTSCLYSSSSASEGDVDEAAANFIINYPADSVPDSPLHENSLNIPLSEREPLLVTDNTLNKNKTNNSSLIFIKKESFQQQQQQNNKYFFNTTANNNRQIQHNKLQQKHFNKNNLRSASERVHKPPKHLPSTYHHQQQQRRSLQLNYNNNLVTTTTCGIANNNYCCTNTNTNTKKLIPVVGGSVSGNILHKHHTNTVINPYTPTTAATIRKQHAYSWYAPVYSALEEELEQDSRVSK